MRTFTTILASVLSNEQAKVPTMEDVSTQRQLSIIKDERTHRALQKMFKESIDEKDFSRFPSFLQDIDAVFVKHGAKGEGKEGETNNDIDDE